MLFIVVGAFQFVFYFFDNLPSADSSIKSPLPDNLTKSFPSVLAAFDIWKPNKVEIIGKNKPIIQASAVASYDLTENKFIYKINENKRLPIASLTKIMTAIVALESMNLETKLKVTDESATIGENSMGLTSGEELTLNELLYGLILNSGNDAAEVIARGSQFGRDNFVFLMNKKAEDLGLTDTHFTNPSGLEGDGKQYSTINDLIVITRYALQNPTFREIVATYHHTIPASSEHKTYVLYNETNLLTSYPGVRGVKTGYTDEAGLCLVTYLEYNGHEIIAVLLNAKNRRQEMKDVLDYSLTVQGIKPPPHI